MEAPVSAVSFHKNRGFQMVENKTVKEFLKGTRNKYRISIALDNNDNIVFDGTYAELKENGKEFLQKIVTSFDAVPMADGTVDIGIMI